MYCLLVCLCLPSFTFTVCFLYAHSPPNLFMLNSRKEVCKWNYFIGIAGFFKKRFSKNGERSRHWCSGQLLKYWMDLTQLQNVIMLQIGRQRVAEGRGFFCSAKQLWRLAPEVHVQMLKHLKGQDNLLQPFCATSNFYSSIGSYLLIN